MKKVFLVVGAALLLGTSQVSAWEGQVIISTPNTSLVLHANEGEDLRQDYYGGLIAEINQLKEAGSDFNFAACSLLVQLTDSSAYPADSA